MRKTASMILLCVFVIFAASGCQQPAKRTGAGGLQDETLINAYYLAGQLGMSVTSTNDEKISFNDTVNTVTLLLKQNQIYVNEEYLGPLGKTKKIDGLLHIRYSLSQEIKNKLVKPVEEKPIAIVPPVPQQEPKKAWELTGKTIVIDPGHGGRLRKFYEIRDTEL